MPSAVPKWFLKFAMETECPEGGPAFKGNMKVLIADDFILAMGGCQHDDLMITVGLIIKTKIRNRRIAKLARRAVQKLNLRFPCEKCGEKYQRRIILVRKRGEVRSGLLVSRCPSCRSERRIPINWTCYSPQVSEDELLTGHELLKNVSCVVDLINLCNTKGAPA